MTTRSLYFAYGSNINPVRMAERAPAARPFAPGWLQDWHVRFDVLSPHYPDGLIAGIYPGAPGAQGMVYELTGEDRSRLDAFEAEADYHPTEVVVRCADATARCIIYLALAAPPAPYRPVPVSPTYLREVADGARHYRLDGLLELVTAAGAGPVDAGDPDRR